MNRKSTLTLTLLGLFVALLGLPVLASAQTGAQGRGRGPWVRRDDNRRNDNRNNRNDNRNNRNDNRRSNDDDYDDDDYNRNRNNRDNGRNNSYNETRLRQSVERVNQLSGSFKRRLDSALDNSRYDDRDIEDRINDVAKDFRDKADDLKDNYNNGRDLSRSADEARELIRLGTQLDQFMSRSRLDSQTQSEWREISRHLSYIGDAYGYNFNASNGNGRGGYGNNRDDDYYGRDGNRNRNGNNRTNGNNRPNGNNRTNTNGRWPN